VTQPERRLEAPHRRLESSPRLVEMAAVVGYKATAAALAHLPPRLCREVIGGFSQLGYLTLPSKRRWSNQNFGHVLGLPPDHPRVRRMALRAYKEYATYMVELMRLPSRPRGEVSSLVEGEGIDRILDGWKASGRAAIVVVGHVGNNEAVAAAIAWRGLPANVVADDSSFPEIFEILRQQRESWGVHVIPWRNLRELFKVLRNNELLALLVDWGYRNDGIPVKLFGAWTTLPAGPATLAAKTGSVIAPMAVRRTANGRFRVDADEVFAVPSSSPADLQRATQRIADYLEKTVAAAPEQWYSFKPIWPSDPDEARELGERAAAMLAVTTAGHTTRPATETGPGPAPADTASSVDGEVP
jgi:phosphatidylinositol dimannoside acyltransferase